ncbi:hypothetical protein [Heyndrickxia acidicola]|uniref:DUF4352 domain-containing protein n=1 Tax=Heyndrickxia acidicola TaxID=209389 RepID=A0ABU6MBA0_9BACI|nr:hypothetical protein [Heyndrickxia acidicola]MED1201699.1 hypothetical protein [Heyndrickxia acidicola]
MNKLVKVLFSGLLAGGLLAGCGNGQQGGAAKNINPSAGQSSQDENKDLNQIGQKVKNEQGTEELVKYKKVNSTVDLNPIKVNVKDIKIIKLTDINPQWLEEISNMTDKLRVKGAVYYVQVRLSIENTTNKHLTFNSLSQIETDQGEDLDTHLNILPSNYNHDITGKGTQDDIYGICLGGGKQDIHKVTLVFDAVKDASTNKILHPEAKTNIKID